MGWTYGVTGRNLNNNGIYFLTPPPPPSLSQHFLTPTPEIWKSGVKKMLHVRATVVQGPSIAMSDRQEQYVFNVFFFILK